MKSRRKKLPRKLTATPPSVNMNSRLVAIAGARSHFASEYSLTLSPDEDAAVHTSGSSGGSRAECLGVPFAAMHILEELEARNLVADITDRVGLAMLLDRGATSFYCGFDPTSKSLHVGNLIPLVLMSRLQRAGHRPVVLVGGATGMVGDPSGKSAERNLQTDEQVRENVAALQQQLTRFLDFSAGPA